MALTGDRLQELTDQHDQYLSGMEDAAAQRVNTALEAAYRSLEKQLLTTYPKIQANDSLLATQRATLVLSEVSSLLAMVNPGNAGAIAGEFESLLQTANQSGGRLADEMIAGMSDKELQATANVPLDAVKFAAENAVNRLSKHSQAFGEKASAIVTQSLIQGWGVQKAAGYLRRELGTTKGQAEMIVRTETLAASNEAMQASFKEAGIEHFLFQATRDDRMCRYCASRNQQVYKLGESKPPIHPRCRCVSVPWMQEWVDDGSFDTAWSKDFREGGLADLQKAGQQPITGISPFEKSAGLSQPPRPVWQPGQALGGKHTELIEQGKAIAGELGDNPGYAELRALRERLLKSGMTREDAIALTENAALDSSLAGMPEEFFANILTDFHQLTGGAARNFQGFFKQEDRAYHASDGWINIGDAPSKDVLFHELGHQLEQDNPELGEAARAWMRSRATGPQQKLSKLTGTKYGDDEVALPDHFADAYIGKVYKSGMTEVVSMGLEHFGHASDMKYLLDRDPEHFYFLVGALSQLQKGKLSGGQPIDRGNEKSFRSLSEGETTAEPRKRQTRPILVTSARTRSAIFGSLNRQQKPETPTASPTKPARPVRPILVTSAATRKRVFSTLNPPRPPQPETTPEPRSGDRPSRQGRQTRPIVVTSAGTRRRVFSTFDPARPTQPTASQPPETTPVPRSTKQLNIKPVTPDLKPLAVQDDLDNFTPANDVQKQALTIAREYHAILKEANEALSKIPGEGHTLPDEAYTRIYSKVDQLMDRLKGTVNEAKAMLGKTGDDTLERYLQAASAASKEALPGFEIRKVNTEIIKKAEERPC